MRNVVSMRPVRRDVSSVFVMEQKSTIQTLGVYVMTALNSVCPTANTV